MTTKIRIAVLEDRQLDLFAYESWLGKASEEIELVKTLAWADDLEPFLAATPVDVLVLDVQVPVSPTNSNYYPIMHVIPKLFEAHPNLIGILVVSMLTERSVIKSVLEAGADGYILKDDSEAIRNLPAIVKLVAEGGFYISEKAREVISKRQSADGEIILTARQIDALELCAAHPEYATNQVAAQLGVLNSTARNLLSSAYMRLGVPNRAAAVDKALRLGLITRPASPASTGPARRGNNGQK